MNKIIIGCDPDSSKSGWAIFDNSDLLDVSCKSIVEIYQFLENEMQRNTPGVYELHIENVKGVSAAFTGRDVKQPMAVKFKMAQFIGMCKQAQVEIERIAEHFGIKVIRHGVSKMWKDSKTGKAALADLGWHGQSTEDSRSAAYFGYLGVKLDKTKNKA